MKRLSSICSGMFIGFILSMTLIAAVGFIGALLRSEEAAIFAGLTFGVLVGAIYGSSKE